MTNLRELEFPIGPVGYAGPEFLFDPVLDREYSAAEKGTVGDGEAATGFSRAQAPRK